MPPLANKESLAALPEFSGIYIVDNLTSLLEQATESLLVRSECQVILKSLMIFALETPLPVSENLFKLDQVSRVNSFHLNSIDQVKYRNWQWIFFIITSSTSNYVPTIEEIAWRKSKAVEMGRLMTNDETASVSLIVGYWIVRLYQGRYPSILMHEFPECLKTAYYEFLKWQGFHWHDKRILSRTLTKVYSFLYASVNSSNDVGSKGNNKLLRNFWNNMYCLGATLKTEQISKTCAGIGTKRLSLYSFHEIYSTLEEFRNFKSVTDDAEEADEKNIKLTLPKTDEKHFVLADAPKNLNLSEWNNNFMASSVKSEGDEEQNGAAVPCNEQEEMMNTQPYNKRFRNNDYNITFSSYPVMKLERKCST